MVTFRIFIATIFRHYTFILEEDPTKSVSNISLTNPPVHQQIEESTGRPYNPIYLGAFPIGAYNGL